MWAEGGTMERATRERRTSRILLVIVAIAAMTLMTAGVAAPAHATVPGENGRIAFARYYNDAQTRGVIFTIQPDGTGVQQITHGRKGFPDFKPDWSPDGRWITFYRQAVICSCKPTRIFKVRANGTHLTQISKDPSFEDLDPAWSPNGKRIAFTRFDDAVGLIAVFVMRADGTHVRQVTPSKYAAQVPQWSPDGTRLVFGGEGSGGTAVFTIRLDGTRIRRLTPWKLHAGLGPDWSPDGRWILLTSHAGQDRQDNLYLVHPNGTDLHRITRSPEGVRQWGSSSISPDGTMITVAHTVGTENQSIWVMGLDGSGLREVTNSRPVESSPDWGPRRS
jgi:Tol biopolymer transport system component